MTRKRGKQGKRGKRKYVPRPINLNPVAYVLRRIGQLPDEDAKAIHMRHVASIDMLARGQCRDEDLGDLMGMANLTAALILGTGTKDGVRYVVDDFDVGAVKRAIRSINERRLRVGRIGASGPELALLRSCLSVLAQLMTVAPCGEFSRVLDYLERRIKSGDVELLPSKPPEALLAAA